MRQPRWFYRWWANLHGYFWLPCRLCGQMYSGFEWTLDGAPTVHEAKRGWCAEDFGICTECAAITPQRDPGF
jgi:hypothetical protein